MKRLTLNEKSLLGIAFILGGILFAVLGGIGIYLALAFGFVGLIICVYAYIDSLPDDKTTKLDEDKSENGTKDKVY